MGSVAKSIGKVASGVAGTVGKVASVAAPFIPGPWGAVAGAAGSLIQGSQDQKQANGYNQQADQMTQAQGQAFNKYYQPVMDGFMKASGYDSKTKQFGATNAYGANAGAANPYGNASNPYGPNAGAPNPYGPTGGATPFGATGGATPYGDNTQNPYTGALGSAQYNKAAEDVDQSFDQSVNQIGADSLTGGFTGANGMADSARLAARTAEASTLSGIRNDLAVKGEDERYRRSVANSDAAWGRQVQSGTESWNRNLQNNNTAWDRNVQSSNSAWDRNAQNVNMQWNQTTANSDANYQRMAAMLPTLTGAGGNAQQDLRGMGAMYQSKANNQGNALGQLAGAVAQTGALDSIFKKRKQSTSMGTSTANAAPKPKTG